MMFGEFKIWKGILLCIVTFGGFIGIVELLMYLGLSATLSAILPFVVFMGVGIWAYNYDLRKTRCPNRDKENKK